MVIDKIQARELGLYIENDGTLYRQMTTPIINNYARRKVKGTFSKHLALKGILNLVEMGRRKYIRDFGGIGIVSGDTKMEVAKILYPHINEASTFEANRLKRQISSKKKLKKGLRRIRKKR